MIEEIKVKIVPSIRTIFPIASNRVCVSVEKSNPVLTVIVEITEMKNIFSKTKPNKFTISLSLSMRPIVSKMINSARRIISRYIGR